MTNGDRIRQMTDEELLEFILKIKSSGSQIIGVTGDMRLTRRDYERRWLDWLKQEVNDGD